MVKAIEKREAMKGITRSKLIKLLEKKSSPGLSALGGPVGRAGAMLWGEHNSNNEFVDFMEQAEKGNDKKELFDELVTDEPVIIEGDKIIVGNMTIDKNVLQQHPELLPPQVVNMIRKKLSNKMRDNIINSSEEQ